jgi:hypothetical protein
MVLLRQVSTCCHSIPKSTSLRRKCKVFAISLIWPRLPRASLPLGSYELTSLLAHWPPQTATRFIPFSIRSLFNCHLNFKYGQSDLVNKNAVHPVKAEFLVEYVSNMSLPKAVLLQAQVDKQNLSPIRGGAGGKGMQRKTWCSWEDQLYKGKVGVD